MRAKFVPEVCHAKFVARSFAREIWSGRLAPEVAPAKLSACEDHFEIYAEDAAKVDVKSARSFEEAIVCLIMTFMKFHRNFNRFVVRTCLRSRSETRLTRSR